MDLVELLRGVELFAGLDEEQLSRLSRISHPEEYRDGDIVFRQGDQGDRLYIIREGQFGVIVGDDPETARPTIYLGTGQIFGEMALVDYGERSATIRCASDHAALSVIMRDDFERLCTADTAIGYIIMRNIASDLSFKLRRQNLRPQSG